MSQTARVALRGSGKETTPTDVANLGTNRIVAGGRGTFAIVNRMEYKN